MKKPIYNSYVNTLLNTIKTAQVRGQKLEHLEENFSNLSGIGKGLPWYDAKKDEINYNSLQQLSNIAGKKKAKYHERLGSHPDFSYLKTANTTEHHYITTMFIDIKNSTALFKKYYPAAVASITTTIQSAAIHTCWYFDAYVQRLHGDGLLVYFGNRSMDVKTSANNALTAAAFISYFIKNDLKNIFIGQGIENIYTRIGIDTGLKEDVLWHQAGMGECSEITTCSLHTSLAAKMQGQAGSNGIMIGDNVKAHTTISQDLFTNKKFVNDGKTLEYVYEIPEDKFRYKQHDFNWEKYLRTHPQIIADDNGMLYFSTKDESSNLAVQRNLDYLKSSVQEYKPSFKK